VAHHRSVRDRLRVGPGFRLDRVDPGAVEVGPDDRDEAREGIAALEDEATTLHERLWAECKGGGQRSLLIVLQGTDTSGKGGATKVVDRLLDPLGFSVSSFG
jgi:polyphosphate kinase 2 (PPK2 family)